IQRDATVALSNAKRRNQGRKPGRPQTSRRTRVRKFVDQAFNGSDINATCCPKYC
ncbi:hypothetical protein BGW42_007407, partial [Actinomortierella wolfii]